MHTMLFQNYSSPVKRKKKVPIHYELTTFCRLYLKARLRVRNGKFFYDIAVQSLVYQMFKSRYYVVEILFSKKWELKNIM